MSTIINILAVIGYVILACVALSMLFVGLQLLYRLFTHRSIHDDLKSLFSACTIHTDHTAHEERRAVEDAPPAYDVVMRSASSSSPQNVGNSTLRVDSPSCLDIRSSPAELQQSDLVLPGGRRLLTGDGAGSVPSVSSTVEYTNSAFTMEDTEMDSELPSYQEAIEMLDLTGLTVTSCDNTISNA